MGIQLEKGLWKGRLVVPCDYSEVSPTDPTGFSSHVIYSDDHGQTWQLGGTISPAVNECQVVELTDGTLMMNMRNYDRGQTTRAIGEAYVDGAPSPVIIIDQRTTYWAPKEPSWHPGYELLPVGRGGTVLKTFDTSRMVGELDDKPAGEVSNDEVWERIQYFYERIVPVAEEYKVRLATHPDDPPMAYYRGVEQVLNSFEGFKKFIDLVPSPYNGLLLCLGCMQEAGEVVPDVIRYFGKRGKIFYVHFRNVIGTVPKYVEVFPDEGDGDMVANMRALKEVDFQGYLVPDHHFLVDADDPGYPLISRAWQVGYIRGLIQTLGV